MINTNSPVSSASRAAKANANDRAPINNPAATKRHSKFYFDNTLIVIQVEDTLFNVHKYQLLKSETFSDMFNMPKEDNEEPEEGSCPEHPIVMEGVSAADFEALMTVLYARTSIGFPSYFTTHQPTPEASLIVPAFRLANMWNFSDLRAYLLPLAETALGDVDKIVFAREFDIQSWLVPAHKNLCERPEPITTEEARRLGIDRWTPVSNIQSSGSGIELAALGERASDMVQGDLYESWADVHSPD
ncbi:unnamed protein product [Rhizoctonia solani]|uniref:BTB domain-containing protein n=1 Tax=Rhizoctonia solani TaxID=456999 RepID=A0A8H3B8H9_9AGAM|nr:unnamed protein product [Rhizoctonia solani]